MDGQKANIALLDLFNDKVASVDYNRDQGFLTGMGIDVKDKTKNGDEDQTGKYTGGKGGDYEIVCNEPTNGAPDQGKTAMETCLAKSKDINLVYTINEPSAAGAAEALEAAGIKATHRLRRRRLRPGHHLGQERGHRGHLAAVPAGDGQARCRGHRQEGPRQCGARRSPPAWTSTTPA